MEWSAVGWAPPTIYRSFQPAFWWAVPTLQSWNVEAIKFNMTMTEGQRWDFLTQLDDELLKGGVILSEWCSFIVKEADLAFVKGAHLASILTVVSGVETYLRSEYAQDRKQRLYELIELLPMDSKLKCDLHRLRQYRNKWVHVGDPWSDEELLLQPEKSEKELEEMAIFAAKVLRRTIYENQWI